MAIRNHINPAFGPRQFVRITTVRTDTRKIEAQLKDGGNIQISLFDVPSFFVWPKEGEYWIVRQDGGYWKLDNKFDNADDTKVVHLAPGEAKVAAEVIKTPSGSSLVTIDKTNVIEVGSIKVVIGTGSPEGVTTAPIGSLFLRKDGAAGSTLYAKTSGESNIGWSAVG
jgi:hypothetical protein